MSRSHPTAGRRKLVDRAPGLPPWLMPLSVWVGVLTALLWSHWSVALSMFKDWQADPNYSVGQLVPLAALYLLWQHRAELSKCRMTPCWWGLAVILIAQIARLGGLLFLFETGERYGLVLTAIGLVLLIAGWDITWRIRWILLFLFLMVPFPGRVHNLISGPLQTWSTSGTFFLLEVFGVTVARDGNVLVLNGNVPVAVAEACSGLRMLTAIGLVLLIAGWDITWRIRWILLFLFLMVPFPGRLHNLISNPLQSWSTSGTFFLLEVFGVTVSQDGNVLVLNGSVPVAVAEACSGLRMLTAFIVVSYVLAYIVKRPRWQKAALVLLSVPIAIVCNLGRLLVTAILFMLTSSETAETFFHDFAGVSMMPLAVLLLVGALWLFNKLVIPDEEGPPQRTRRARRRQAAGNSRG